MAEELPEVSESEQRKRQANQRYKFDLERLEKLRLRTEPQRVALRQVFRRFRPLDTDWPTPLETAAIEAFREDFPGLSEEYEKYLDNQNCSCKGTIFTSLGDDIQLFQKTVDRVFGEGVFSVTAVRTNLSPMIGKSVIIDPTPKAFEDAMVEFAGPQLRHKSLYNGVVVKDTLDDNGDPKWVILFY